MLTTTRRGFLGSLIGGVAVSAAVRSWPFRVFSFPNEIKLANKLWWPGKGMPTALRFVKYSDPRCPNRLLTKFDAFYGFVPPPPIDEADRWKQMMDNDLIIANA